MEQFVFFSFADLHWIVLDHHSFHSFIHSEHRLCCVSVRIRRFNAAALTSHDYQRPKSVANFSFDLALILSPADGKLQRIPVPMPNAEKPLHTNVIRAID